MSMADTFTHKVGPLPVGGWLAIVGGAYLASHYLRSKAAATANTQADVAGVPGVNLAPDQAQLSATTGTAPPSSNAEWATKAFTALVGSAFPADPSVIDDALRRFIAGKSEPNSGEQAVINSALRLVGALPDPLYPTDAPPLTTAHNPPPIHLPGPPPPPAPSPPPVMVHNDPAPTPVRPAPPSTPPPTTPGEFMPAPADWYDVPSYVAALHF